MLYEEIIADCSELRTEHISTLRGHNPPYRSWLRHYATSRYVVGSIPDGVIRIFYLNNTSGRTMAPGSTQPLSENSTMGV